MMGLIFKTHLLSVLLFILLLYSPSPNAKAQKLLNTTRMLIFLKYLFIHIWPKKDSHKQIETIKYKKEKKMCKKY